MGIGESPYAGIQLLELLGPALSDAVELGQIVHQLTLLQHRLQKIFVVAVAVGHALATGGVGGVNEQGQLRKAVTLVKNHVAGQLIVLVEPSDLLRSEEHTSELQSRPHLVCRLLLEKKKKK